jgi:hypothetical protein
VNPRQYEVRERGRPGVVCILTVNHTLGVWAEAPPWLINGLVSHRYFLNRAIP